MTDFEKDVCKTLSKTWDKDCAFLLRQEGLTQEQIAIVLGLLAEHRQGAYLDGWKRGYEQAHKK